MVKIRRDSDQQDFKIADPHGMLSNLNNCHSLEVVNRVRETQLKVAENSISISWRLKC